VTEAADGFVVGGTVDDILESLKFAKEFKEAQRRVELGLDKPMVDSGSEHPDALTEEEARKDEEWEAEEMRLLQLDRQRNARKKAQKRDIDDL
jgi:hypothetical protein